MQIIENKTYPRNRYERLDFTGALWLLESYPQEYNREQVVATIPDVTEILSGSPFTIEGLPLIAGEEDLCDGLLLDTISQLLYGLTIEGERRVTLLTKGNCVILSPYLPVNDYAGSKFDRDVLSTRLRELGFVVIDDVTMELGSNTI